MVTSSSKPARKTASKSTARKSAGKGAKPRKPGRPSTFTPAIGKEICDRLSKGEPLAVICRDDRMPAVRTVSDWKSSSETFAADIARAREEGFDAIAAECLEIADASEKDTIIIGAGESEREAVNTEWISRSKLRVETRLKLLAKWDPNRYGERINQHHTGSIGLEGLVAGDDEQG